VVEAGLIGCEGMSGTSILLDSLTSPHRTYMQVAGAAQRIRTDAFRKAFRASKTLHGALLKYVQVFVTQAMHSAVVNARGKLNQRLARSPPCRPTCFGTNPPTEMLPHRQVMPRRRSVASV
jgi:hypothetical protein